MSAKSADLFYFAHFHLEEVVPLIGTDDTERYPIAVAMGVLGVDVPWLVQETGLNHNVVRRAMMGGKKRIKYDTAYLIADALGMGIEELQWPSGLTHLGRPPLTGTGTLSYSVPSVPRPSCPEHFILLSSAGNCSYCEQQAAELAVMNV
ncbi:hypothetical protein KI440_02870 [Candidatus Saccharibacteria bacterium TM7i]|nr:hypothetical protein KI440_02870 [Candidatus Saccharibacteria bacterium TM7i]